MKATQAMTDKLAMGLSAMCAIHCLALPVILALLPSLAVLQLDNEIFHILMVLIVIPTSCYALTLGCRQHQRYRLLALGGIGIAFLIIALVIGESVGEAGEKILTLIGASFVAAGHWFNYRLCKQKSQSDCGCHTEN